MEEYCSFCKRFEEDLRLGAIKIFSYFSFFQINSLNNDQKTSFPVLNLERDSSLRLCPAKKFLGDYIY